MAHVFNGMHISIVHYFATIPERHIIIKIFEVNDVFHIMCLCDVLTIDILVVCNKAQYNDNGNGRMFVPARTFHP